MRNQPKEILTNLSGCKAKLIFTLPLLFIVIVLFFSGCEEGKDILNKLKELEGVTVTEIDPFISGTRLFQIDLDQPVDHANPGGQRFTQRIYLHHKNESEPMVFVPHGYMTEKTITSQVFTLLNSNCMTVTHRYFEGAKPDPMNLQYLTIAQAAADHHRIVTIFKKIYTGKWLSYGLSKSGGCAIYHKRFYPDDVIATVVLGTPFMFGTEDQRFPPFINTLGTEEDRQRIRGFQRLVLEKRETLIPLFVNWFPQNNQTLAWDADQAFEGLVIEYENEFWQQKPYDTTAIPTATATDQVILDHLNRIMPFLGASEWGINFYLPSLYQHYTEIGWPAFDKTHINDLLIAEERNYEEMFLNELGIELRYNADVMLDIVNWIVSEGNNIIFVYGGNDPWTAAAIQLQGLTNAVKIIHPGASHLINLSDLSRENWNLFISTLEEWLDIDID